MQTAGEASGVLRSACKEAEIQVFDQKANDTVLITDDVFAE